MGNILVRDELGSFVFAPAVALYACSSGCSQLSVFSLKVFTSSCLSNVTGNVIPTVHNPVAEKVSPDLQAALSHFQIERVR